MTENFWIVIELVTTKSSTSHDRVGRANNGTHNGATPRCVAIEDVMRVRQTRPSEHDRPWARTTEVRSW